MELEERDRLVRASAFMWLERQVDRHGEVLPLSRLREGFAWEGKRVPLMGPQGIFKPAVIPELPLSITTVPAVEGRERPYEDEMGPDGFLRYRYRGRNIRHRDNVGLRKAMERQVPLVYLYGTAPGWYRPEWPVFIVGDDPSTFTFTVALDDPQALRSDLTIEVVDDARRSYLTRLARHGSTSWPSGSASFVPIESLAQCAGSTTLSCWMPPTSFPTAIHEASHL